jgi:cytoskeletal protein RodZ
MIGQQAVCPTCNAVFELRLEDSREYQREQDALRQRKEAEAAEKWLKRAIWAAVFIVASLIGMTVLYAVFRRGSRRESPPPPQEIVAPVEAAAPETASPSEGPAEPVAE